MNDASFPSVLFCSKDYIFTCSALLFCCRAGGKYGEKVVPTEHSLLQTAQNEELKRAAEVVATSLAVRLSVLICFGSVFSNGLTACY